MKKTSVKILVKTTKSIRIKQQETNKNIKYNQFNINLK